MQYVMTAVNAVGLVFLLYLGYVMIVGLFVKPKEKSLQSEAFHRIGIVVAARNEEKVIGRLLESLKKQDYPTELYDVFVVPNNCSDSTEETARLGGAKIFPVEREVHTKGEVLSDVLPRLVRQFDYDFYLIFDADNVVDPAFLKTANRTFNQGYDAGQGRRESLNPTDDWVSGCMSIFFWFMNGLFNRPRHNLGISAHINGTGVMISSRLLREDGYRGTTLTEDIEFNTRSALNGRRIAWMDGAVTYDEQPCGFKLSVRQRKRWTVGTLQVAVTYLGQVIRSCTKNRSSWDIFCYLSSVALMLPTLWGNVIVYLIRIVQSLFSAEGAGAIMIELLVLFAGFNLIVALLCLILCVLQHKMRPGLGLSIAMMGIFLISWSVINMLCLLGRRKEWIPIPHGETRKKS